MFFKSRFSAFASLEGLSAKTSIGVCPCPGHAFVAAGDHATRNRWRCVPIAWILFGGHPLRLEQYREGWRGAPRATSPPTATVFRPIGHTRNTSQYITNWLYNDIDDDTGQKMTASLWRVSGRWLRHLVAPAALDNPPAKQELPQAFVKKSVQKL